MSTKRIRDNTMVSVVSVKQVNKLGQGIHLPYSILI